MLSGADAGSSESGPLPASAASASVNSTAAKPRVSFNRDVHVKRIGPRESPTTVSALSGVGPGLVSTNGDSAPTRLLATPVRREKLGHLSRKELAEEAARVLQQADRVQCVSKGSYPEKFYSLPSRKKNRILLNDSPNSSTERHPTSPRRRSEELGVTVPRLYIDTPPRKPPRSFLSRSHSDATPERPHRSKTPKNSLRNLFKKSTTKIKRSKSDGSDKSAQPTHVNRSYSDAADKSEQSRIRKRPSPEHDDASLLNKKTQLTPIIEVSPAVEQAPKTDYFSAKPTNGTSDKENEVVNNINNSIELKPPERKKWRVQSQNTKLETPAWVEPPEIENINANSDVDQVDSSLRTITSTPKSKNAPAFVIIDVENATNIPSYKNPLRKSFEDRLSSTLRSFTKRKTKINSNKKGETAESPDKNDSETNTNAKYFQSIKSKFESDTVNKSEDMIHSSQKPVDRLPLTRGKKVDNMVKRLSHERFSPPPKTTSILITPSVGMQHNNNQPFSYTKPSVSPEMEYYPRNNRNSLSPERDLGYNRSYHRPITPEEYSRSRSPNYARNGYSREYIKSYDSTVTANSGKYDRSPKLGDYPRVKSPSKFRPLSPKVGDTFEQIEHRTEDPSVPGQIIYAQVVCGPEAGDHKQTVHRSYNNESIHKKTFLQNSDSDEGLGYEEHFGKTTRMDLKDPYKAIEDDGPITPKYQSHIFTKKEHLTNSLDTSVLRGRADGMDSKRRGSLTEANGTNGRNDLSSRRELLESRINSRNKSLHTGLTPNAKQFLVETTARYYRNGSASPVGFTEKYTSESVMDKSGEVITKESRSKQHYGEENRPGSSPKYLNGKEFHQSNPELIAQKRYGDAQERRNNTTAKYEENRYTSYHDSLKRNKYETERNDSMRRMDKFVDSGIENDFRRDPAENGRVQHIRNDSEDEGFQSSLLIAVEKQQTEENRGRKTEYSEFRKERRDVEYQENGVRHHHRDYDDMDREFRSRRELDDSDREYRRRDLDESDRDLPRHKDKSDTLRKKKQVDYVPRERSIDDGSHFDPRIDKDLDKNGKKLEKKPPKAEKKVSGLNKVKNLFSSKKSKEKRSAKAESQLMVEEEEMRARYSEYKGSKEDLDTIPVGVLNRMKLKTPEGSRTPSPEERETHAGPSRPNGSAGQSGSTLSRDHKQHSSANNGGWFKSLDRLTRKNKKIANQGSDKTKIPEIDVSEPDYPPPISKPQKNLRFFGDTDLESNADSVRHKSSLKHRPSLSSTLTRTPTHSHRNLNNIDESSDVESKHKEYRTESKVSLKPPMSPHERRTTRNGTIDVERRRTNGGEALKKVRRNDSLAESSTEGDSSQQSQRSVVYLHAATVGDIPGPASHSSRLGRRAASREELNSIHSSTRVQPQVKTLSRSFSVLAPWKPRHNRDRYDIDYSQQTTRPKVSSSSTVKSKIESKSRNGSSTLNRRSKSKENISSSTLNRRTKSKDNISLAKSREDVSKNGSMTLNRKSKDSALDKKSKSKDNLSTLSRKSKTKDNDSVTYKKREKSYGNNKSMSLESLGTSRKNKDSDKERREKVSRSVSMPKDKSAGWFGKKTKK